MVLTPKEKNKFEAQREAEGLIRFGRSIRDAIDRHICAQCGEPAYLFRTQGDEDMFYLTGLCQKCQDDTSEQLRLCETCDTRAGCVDYEFAKKADQVLRNLAPQFRPTIQ